MNKNSIHLEFEIKLLELHIAELEQTIEYEKERLRRLKSQLQTDIIEVP